MDALKFSSDVSRLEVVEVGRRRRWSLAAKLRIVADSLAAPRQVSATARRHGISRALLTNWRRAYLAGGWSREALGFLLLTVAEPVCDGTRGGAGIERRRREDGVDAALSQRHRTVPSL